jgi:PKD repeat protein
VLIICLLAFAYSTRSVNAATTRGYPDITLTPPGVWTVMSTHYGDVWDLTKGDLMLSYTIDMSNVAQPMAWDTSYTEVGLRTEGASDFNPGPFGVYQGGCGGWMTSLYGDLTPSPTILSLFDKHNLGASGGEGEGDYDCLVPGTVTAPFGSGSNHGIWFDRDGVDPWQDDDPLTPPPGGSSVSWGSHNGLTYNTGGIYQIVIQYHAINANLGSMFATVNGQPTGFYLGGYHDGVPDYYPAGLSFKGDMTRMQVFEGIIAPGSGAVYGYTVIHNLIVIGTLGVSSPLTANFNYSPTTIGVGTSVHFTDATTGGYLPYSAWSWDFGDGGTSTAQNPSHVYTTPGDYNVKLTVTGDCPDCGSATITKTIHVCAYYLTVTSPYDTPTGQGWYDAGATVTSSVTSPAGNEFCTGWTGTGSAPPSGTMRTVTFTITQPSTITWNWEYLSLLGPSVGGQWTPITMQALSPLNTLGLLAPWIALGLIAAATIVAGYRRLIKKHC